MHISVCPNAHKKLRVVLKWTVKMIAEITQTINSTKFVILTILKTECGKTRMEMASHNPADAPD
jgi:hypothetical protein